MGRTLAIFIFPFLGARVARLVQGDFSSGLSSFVVQAGGFNLRFRFRT